MSNVLELADSIENLLNKCGPRTVDQILKDLSESWQELSRSEVKAALAKLLKLDSIVSEQVGEEKVYKIA